MKNTTILGLMAVAFLTSAAVVASIPSFVTGGIIDGNSKPILGLPDGPSTVANHVVIKSAAPSAPPTLTVDGTDANPSIAIHGKGTGNVLIQGSDTENIVAFEDSQNAREYATFTSGAIGDGVTLRADSAVSAEVDFHLNSRGRGRVYINGNDPLTRTWTGPVRSPGLGQLYTLAIADETLVPRGLNVFALGGGSITVQMYRSFVKNSGAGTAMGPPLNVTANGVSFSFIPPSGAAAVMQDGEIIWFEVTGLAGTVTEVCVQLATIIP